MIWVRIPPGAAHFSLKQIGESEPSQVLLCGLAIVSSLICPKYEVTCMFMFMNNQVHRALFRKEGEGKERERKKITTTSTA